MSVSKNEKQIQNGKVPLFISSFFFFCKSGVGQRIEPSVSCRRLARLIFVDAFNPYRESELICNYWVLNSKSGGTTFSADISNHFCQRGNF